MDIDQLLSEWENDSVIDALNAGQESLRTAKLQAKYLRIYTNSVLRVKDYKNKYAITRKVKWQYFNGHFNTDKEMLEKLGLEPFKIILKADIPIYLEADEELITLNSRIAYHEQMVNICERILTSIKNRGFDIKTYVDVLKFEAGG